MKGLNIVPFFTKTELFFTKYSTAFTLLVMYQGLFGGIAISNKPKILEELAKNKIFKIFTLLCIAFTATRDVEISIIATILFLVLLHLMRTDEERKKAFI